MKLYYNVETAYENSGLTYYDFFSQFVQNDEEKFSPEQILTSIQNQTEFPVLNASLELHQLDRLSKREVDAVKQTIEATKSIVTKIEKDPIGKFLYDFKDGEERNYSNNGKFVRAKRRRTSRQKSTPLFWKAKN